MSRKGKSFYLDNARSNSSDKNSGTYRRPLKTLQEAINRCVDDRGDLIAVTSTHIELFTHPISINKKHVVIMGVGDFPMFMFMCKADYPEIDVFYKEVGSQGKALITLEKYCGMVNLKIVTDLLLPFGKNMETLICRHILLQIGWEARSGKVNASLFDGEVFNEKKYDDW